MSITIIQVQDDCSGECWDSVAAFTDHKEARDVVALILRKWRKDDASNRALGDGAVCRASTLGQRWWTSSSKKQRVMRMQTLGEGEVFPCVSY